MIDVNSLRNDNEYIYISRRRGILVLTGPVDLSYLLELKIPKDRFKVFSSSRASHADGLLWAP